jgi:hypothetical protein
MANPVKAPAPAVQYVCGPEFNDDSSENKYFQTACGASPGVRNGQVEMSR